MGRPARIGAVAAVLVAGFAASAQARVLAGPFPANDLQPLVGLTGGVTPSFVVVQGDRPLVGGPI